MSQKLKTWARCDGFNASPRKAEAGLNSLTISIESPVTCLRPITVPGLHTIVTFLPSLGPVTNIIPSQRQNVKSTKGPVLSKT